jgi:hypothetical protein
MGIVLDLHKVDAVGLGTLLLAAATAFLAVLTYFLLRAGRDDRKIAQEALAAAQSQAEIAQRSLDSEIRPILAEVPLNVGVEELIYYPDRAEPVHGVEGGVHVWIDDSELLCSVPFRNVGRGLAKVETAYIEGAGRATAYRAADITRPNIAVGERTRAVFRFRRGEAGYAEVGHRVRTPDDWVAAIRYTDVGDRQVTATKLQVRFRSRAHTNWEVEYVEITDPDTGEAPPPGAMGPPLV